MIIAPVSRPNPFPKPRSVGTASAMKLTARYVLSTRRKAARHFSQEDQRKQAMEAAKTCMGPHTFRWLNK